MRIRKQHAAQVRFDEPLPLEVELARPAGADADGLRARIEESVAPPAVRRWYRPSSTRLLPRRASPPRARGQR
jgi:hypothetical protein